MTILLATQVTEGTVIAGKYRVKRVLRDGGRGVVAEATSTELGNPVALRLLGPICISPREDAPGFLEAAKRAALLRSDRAEQPLDFGTAENGTPFITTPLLEGLDLGSELARSGALRVEDAVDFVIQACEALADAHRVGVIYCDVRPDKLFVSTRDGAPFVTVLISLISMFEVPVEPARGRAPLDHRVDVYGLGVTLCALLAGKPPFWFRTLKPSPSGRVIVETEHTGLSSSRPDLPRHLVSVIEKAYARTPDARHDSMASFALALEPFAPPRSWPVLARLVHPSAAPRKEQPYR
jgi:serine/threonine-protein kinase